MSMQDLTGEIELLTRALMFRQDYRINKIFLPFRKKGKKHHPYSSRDVHSLRQQNDYAREKASIVEFSELRLNGFIWKPFKKSSQSG